MKWYRYADVPSVQVDTGYFYLGGRVGTGPVAYFNENVFNSYTGVPVPIKKAIFQVKIICNGSELWVSHSVLKTGMNKNI